VQLYDLQGRLVRPDRIRQAGIFLAGTEGGYLQKVTVIK
jgi:hypothetical protein